MQRVIQNPPTTFRFLKIRGGSVAVFGKNTCTQAKAMNVTPKTTSNAMMRPSLH